MGYIFKYILILGSIILLVGCLNSKKEVNKIPVKQDKPNLLFIFPDQWRNAAVGINKQDPVHTPHLDQLAKEGMVISNAVSNFPLCSPYRGMLMTGKLPYNNKILTNSNSKRYKFNNSWQKEDTSFSDVLVKNGYDAGYVGKLHLTSPPPIKGKDTTLWNAFTPIEQRHEFNFWYSYGAEDKHFSPSYWINDAKEQQITYVNEWSPLHEANVVIDYIKNHSKETRSKGKPFALFWSVNPPHPPYQDVPEQYLESYKDKSLDELLVRENVNLETDAMGLAFHNGATRKRTHLAKEYVREYFAAVTGVDEQIGRVLRTLEEQGQDDNTIVVITSDHGEMMGSHGLMSKNVWYEEAINIPFIIRWPDKIKGGQKDDLMVSVTDLMPTILNMMGATDGIPENLDGQDLSSIILENKGVRPKSVMYYYIEEGRPESGHRGIRTYNNTYVITVDSQNEIRKILFDNINDPYQLNNISGKGLKVEKTLHYQLLQELKAKKDPWLEQYHKLNTNK